MLERVPDPPYEYSSTCYDPPGPIRGAILSQRVWQEAGRHKTALHLCLAVLSSEGKWFQDTQRSELDISIRLRQELNGICSRQAVRGQYTGGYCHFVCGCDVKSCIVTKQHIGSHQPRSRRAGFCEGSTAAISAHYIQPMIVQ